MQTLIEEEIPMAMLAKRRGWKISADGVGVCRGRRRRGGGSAGKISLSCLRQVPRPIGKLRGTLVQMR